MVNQCHIRHAGRIVNFLYASLFVINHIRYVGHCGNDIHIKLTVQTFLNYFHVKKSKKTASETKSKSYGRFGLECQRGIIQLKFFQ